MPNGLLVGHRWCSHDSLQNYKFNRPTAIVPFKGEIIYCRYMVALHGQSRHRLALASTLALASVALAVGVLLALAGLGALASLTLAGAARARLCVAGTVGAGLGAVAVGGAGHCGLGGGGKNGLCGGGCVAECGERVLCLNLFWCWWWCWFCDGSSFCVPHPPYIHCENIAAESCHSQTVSCGFVLLLSHHTLHLHYPHSQNKLCFIQRLIHLEFPRRTVQWRKPRRMWKKRETKSTGSVR